MSSDKTVFITGANRGLGLGFCKKYLQLGYTVCAAARNPNTPELKSLRSDYAGRLNLIEMDILSLSSIQAAYKQTSKLIDRIDILINNAGRYGNEDLIDEQDMLLTYQTNAVGPLLVAKTFLPLVEASKTKKIVNISTLMASIADNQSSGAYAYRLSKVALNMMNKNLSIDLKKKNISSLALHPGWVKTDMGGPNARLTIDTSIQGMVDVIDKVTLDDSGAFLDYQGKALSY